MSKFKATKITNSGQQLLLDSIAGEAEIQFTRMAFGNGSYGNEDVISRESLKHEVQTVPISSLSIKSRSSIVLSSIISNEELTQGYRMTEIGLFAKNKADVTSEEILYAIGVAENSCADYIPEYNGYAPVRIIQDFYIEVADASSTTILIDEDALLKRGYFDEKMAQFAVALANCAGKERTEEIDLQIGGQGITAFRSVTCKYTRIGNQVTFVIPPIEHTQLTNSNFFTLQNIPAEITPASPFAALMYHDNTVGFNDYLSLTKDLQGFIIRRSTAVGESDYYFANATNGGFAGGMFTYFVE